MNIPLAHLKAMDASDCLHFTSCFDALMFRTASTLYLFPESSSGDGFSFRFRGPGVGERDRPEIGGRGSFLMLLAMFSYCWHVWAYSVSHDEAFD